MLVIDYKNPRLINTKQEVDEVNEVSGQSRWKIGDTCYLVKKETVMPCNSKKPKPPKK